MELASLRSRVSAWDGKSARDIREIYNAYCGDTEFIDSVVSLVGGPQVEIGATWLLKHHLENGGSISDEQTQTIYQSFPKLNAWESKLHLLQCMRYMPVPTTELTTTEQFVRGHLSDNNKFVRAWSYSGFYELAVRFPHLQREALQLFEMGMRDEPASVKARIRNVLKKGF